jgi:hypothetical protein
VKHLSILIKKIEQSLKQNPISVPLLDIVNDFGYRLWDYENNKIIRSRDVIFNEKVMYKYQLQGKKQEKEKQEYTVLDEITEKEIPKDPENQNVQQQEQ